MTNDTMESSDADPVSEYRSSLQDLTFNSKPLISMLTMLADDYKDTKAPDIVRCVEQRLHQVTGDKKLPILYLLDSICKNIGEIYVKLFTQNIVSNFCDVFEKVDEKTRLSLYKLRQTWNDIFPQRKLYAIDARIHEKHDPAWPITAPKPNDSKSISSVVQTSQTKDSLKQQPYVRINPKFINPSSINPSSIKPSSIKPNSIEPSSIKEGLSTSTVAVGDPDLSKKILQRQQELLQIEKQRIELEAMNKRKQLIEKERALQEKEAKLKEKEQQLRGGSPVRKKRRKRSRSRRSRSRSPSPARKSRSPSRHDYTSKSHNKQKSRSPAKIPFTNQIGVNSDQISGPIITPSALIVAPPSGSSAVPTTIPAPNILAQPEMLNITSTAPITTTINVIRPFQPATTGISGFTQSTVLPTIQPTTSSILDQSQINPWTVPWSKDRDYRREYDTIISEANEKLRSGAISSSDHLVLLREVERTMRENLNSNQGILNAQTAIAQPNDSLTMLVDGKLRKLFYLDDSTAVVLLEAPKDAKFQQLIEMDPVKLDPKLISFDGKPTKVFIDSDRGSNDWVLLEFNSQHQTFFHNDHEQRIKFGGPAKEIIFNGQAYQAKFGGPPIEVWFNGDSTTVHSLKLDGPPPRVKLSDEPKYDLWASIVRTAKSNVKNNVNVNETQPNVVSNDTTQRPFDINSLLSKLVAAGMIGKNNNSNSNNSNSNLNKNVTINNSNNSLPVNQLTQADKSFKTEKKNNENGLELESPLELTTDSLKKQRPSLIHLLYSGIQCTNCSLRFDEKDQVLGDKSKYSKHLDWHFRQNRRDRAKPSSSSAILRRNWYYPLQLWCQFKEVADEDEAISNVFAMEKNESESEEETPISTVTASKNEDLNQCAVCCEKFELIWNEDEEEWKLINAVKHIDEKVYHPLCLEDFIAQHERQNSIVEEDESRMETSCNESENKIESSNKLQDSKLNQEESLNEDKALGRDLESETKEDVQDSHDDVVTDVIDVTDVVKENEENLEKTDLPINENIENNIVFNDESSDNNNSDSKLQNTEEIEEKVEDNEEVEEENLEKKVDGSILTVKGHEYSALCTIM